MIDFVLASLRSCVVACEANPACVGFTREAYAQDADLVICNLLDDVTDTAPDAAWSTFTRLVFADAPPLPPEPPSPPPPVPPPPVPDQPPSPPPQSPSPPPSPPSPLPPSPPYPPPPSPPSPPPPGPDLSFDDDDDDDDDEGEGEDEKKLERIVDQTPPVITLLGDGELVTEKRGRVEITFMLHEVPLRGEWVEPPVSLSDNLDQNLNVASVQMYGGAVDTAVPTLEPIELRYSVVDASGNVAAPVGRLVRVLCPEDAPACPGDVYDPTPSCPVLGVCGTSSELQSITAGNLPDGAEAPPSSATIELVGDAEVELDAGASYGRCPSDAAPADVCDRGVRASTGPDDGVPGGALTANVHACADEFSDESLFAEVGLAECGLPNPLTVGTYELRFTVPRPGGGDDLAVTRTLRVLPVCTPEVVCANKVTCSVDGFCEGEQPGADDPLATDPEPPVPPTLILDGAGVGLNVKVRRYYAYAACRPGEVSSEAKPCEPAPESTGTVYVLPAGVAASSCLTVGCTGYEYTSNGISLSGLDTSVEDGNVFIIRYVALDPVTLGLASADRTVTIDKPCPDDEEYCDGYCYQVTCEVAAQLAPPPPLPGILELVGPAMLFLQYGHTWISSDGSLGSLLPCAGAASTGCGVLAVDATTREPLESADITVEETTPPEQLERCEASLVGDVSSGVRCVPALYRYTYTLWSDDGEAVDSLTRQVLIRAVASLSFQFQVPNIGTVEAAAVEDTTLEALEAALLGAANAQAPGQFAPASVSLGSLDPNPGSPGEALLRLVLLLPPGLELELSPEQVAEYLVQGDGGSAPARRAGGALGVAVLGSSFTPAAEVDPVAGRMASLLSAFAPLPRALDAAGASLRGAVADTAAWLADDGLDNTALSEAAKGWMEDAAEASSQLEGNATAISATADALLEAQAANAAAAASTIAALEEGISTAEAFLRDLANTQEFLDSIGGISSDNGASSKPCLATSSERVGSYEISFQRTPDEEESRRRRQLLQAEGDGAPLGSAQLWQGYRVIPRSAYERQVDLTDAPELSRYLGPAKGGNRMLGGLVLHQLRRGQDPAACDIHFDHLSSECAEKRFLERVQTKSNSSVLDEYLQDVANPLLPYGADPVFVRGLGLYNSQLDGQEGRFYNMTPGSDDLNINDAPVLFAHRPLPGAADGFPVVLPPELDAGRAGLLMAALEQGNYMDRRTVSLALRLAAYNPKLQVLSYAEASFSWNADGSVVFSAGVPKTVPTFLPTRHDLGCLAGLALLIIWLTLMSDLPALLGAAVTKAVALLRRKLALKPAHSGVLKPGGSKSAGSPVTALLKKASSFKEMGSPVKRTSSMASMSGAPSRRWATGSVLDALILGFLLLGTVAALLGMLLETRLSGLATSYPIYDDITTAPAAFFEPAKAASGTEVDVALALDGAEEQAGARWAMPDSETGLETFGGALGSVSSVSAVLALAGAAHGIALVLAVVRLVHVWGFQPRVGVIYATVSLSLPDLANLMVLVLVIVVFIGAGLHLVMGDVYVKLSTAGGAIDFLAFYLLTGDLGDLHAAASPAALERNVITLIVARVLYIMVSFLLGYMVLSFLLAILGEEYYRAKQDLSSGPDGMPNMLTEVKQLLHSRRGVAACRQALARAHPGTGGHSAQGGGKSPMANLLSLRSRRRRAAESREEDALTLLEHWAAKGWDTDPVGAFRPLKHDPLELVKSLTAELEAQLAVLDMEGDLVEEMLCDVQHLTESTTALALIAGRSSATGADDGGIEQRVARQATRQKLRMQSMSATGGSTRRNLAFTDGVVATDPMARAKSTPGEAALAAGWGAMRDSVAGGEGALPGTPEEVHREQQMRHPSRRLRGSTTRASSRTSDGGAAPLLGHSSWKSGQPSMDSVLDQPEAEFGSVEELPTGTRVGHKPGGPARGGWQATAPAAVAAKPEARVTTPSGFSSLFARQSSMSRTPRDSESYRGTKSRFSKSERSPHASEDSATTKVQELSPRTSSALPVAPEPPPAATRGFGGDATRASDGSTRPGAGVFLPPKGSRVASTRPGQGFTSARAPRASDGARSSAPTGRSEATRSSAGGTGSGVYIFSDRVATWAAAPANPNVQVTTTAVRTERDSVAGDATARPTSVLGRMANFFRPGTAM